MTDFDALRRQYADVGLDESVLAADPLVQVGLWLNQAVTAGVREANAMVLATASPDGRPSARTVLLKGLDERGLVFYTNLGSAKSSQLIANPRAAAVFTWLELERQVRASGRVEAISDAEADAYFASRPREAQLSAWASPQSRPIPNREWLIDQVAKIEERFGDGELPRPETWGGWRLVPDEVEIWQGRAHRLHDRIRYRRQGEDWLRDRLAP
jgi:pyridoxamine 5'-phosphate oxidase